MPKSFSAVNSLLGSTSALCFGLLPPPCPGGSFVYFFPSLLLCLSGFAKSLRIRRSLRGL
jgi:hypothetical protein